MRRGASNGRADAAAPAPPPPPPPPPRRAAPASTVAGEIDWGTYLTNTLWLWMGFDQIGSVAGEVQNVGRTLSVGVVIAAFSVSFVYSVPVVIGMCVMPDLTTWQAGSFVTLGNMVLGSWGGYMIAVAGMLSSVGIFEATLATTSRALWAMAGGCPDEIPVPMVPRALAYSRTVGECTVPVAAVLCEALVTAVLVNISFQARAARMRQRQCVRAHA
jgi:amino acid transporter